jgi:hypothetical protein
VWWVEVGYVSTESVDKQAAVGQPRQHRLAKVLMWVFGVIATGLTVILGINLVAVAQQWSSYVGGESTAALVILGGLGVVVAAAWLTTWLTWRAIRN